MTFDAQVRQARLQRHGGVDQPFGRQAHAFRRAGASRGIGNLGGPFRQLYRGDLTTQPGQVQVLLGDREADFQRENAFRLISDHQIGPGLFQGVS